MNAIQTAWVEIGHMDDIPQQGARCVSVGDMTVAIFRTVDDNVFALEDKCPHKNGPLSQGIVHDGCVTCPLHNWIISLETGLAQGADDGEVQSFPLNVSEGKILLDIGSVR